MDGKIRSKQKCPQCKANFVMTVVQELGPYLQLCCPACKTRPRKYYIDLYSKGFGKIKLYSDQQGNPLSSWEHAERVLVGIRYEIDQKRFDPTKYAKRELKEYLFEFQIEQWYQGKMHDVQLGNLANSYVRTLRLFKENYFKRHFAGMDVREIRGFHIDEFYRKLPVYLQEYDNLKKGKRKKGKWSLKYIKNIMTSLEGFFNTLLKIERIERCPAFPEITVDRKAPKWADREVQLAVINDIHVDDRPIFTFLALQGVRPGEGCALKIKDFDFTLENESFTAVRTFSDRKLRERVKSKVERPRALNPVLVPMLKELCLNAHPEAFVFINRRTRKPYSNDILQRIWKKAKAKRGLGLTLYQATRHSFASNLLKDGVDISIISKLLGHTDLRSSLIYTHADLATQKVAFKKQAQAQIIELRPQTGPKNKKAE